MDVDDPRCCVRRSYCLALVSVALVLARMVIVRPLSWSTLAAPILQPSGSALGDGGNPVVWATGDARKVLPNDQPEASNYVWSGARRLVRLSGAGNETVPFQIVITTGNELRAVDITASDFTGPGTIGADAITFYRQAFYNVSANSDPWGYGVPPAVHLPGQIPDALIPFTDPYDRNHRVGAPFYVPRNSSQPIWVDIAVPPDVVPGDYRSTFTVRTRGRPLATLRVSLHVWDFTLPDRSTLIVFLPADPFWTLPPQYDIPGNARHAILALAEKMNQVTFAHRLIPGTFFRRPIVTERRGILALDFTASDAEMAPYVAGGLPLFFPSNPWNSEKERYDFRDSRGRYYTAADFDDPLFVDKVKQYYTALRDHYVALGWFDKALTYPGDETEWVADEPMHNGPSGFQRLFDWARAIKSVSPDFRISASSVYPIPPGPPSRGWIDLRGFLDDWEVVADDVALDPGLYQSRQALGETVSYYFNDYGDFIDYKATLHRALAWHAYIHNVYSIGGWASAAWIDDNYRPRSPWTTPLNGIYGHGGGALFWPGHHIEGKSSVNIDGPLPSLRLKLAREAIEDFDYLTMLANATSADYARDVAQAIVTGDLFHTDLSPRAFYAQRDWIGAILAGETAVSLTNVTGTVTDAATGEPIAGAVVRATHTATPTAADGSYTLTLGVGEPLVNISHGRYISRTLPLTGSTLDVPLTPLTADVTPLFSFETTRQIGKWEFANVVSAERSSLHVTDGAYSVKVVFGDKTTEEADMGTWRFSPTDWRDYTALEFEVYNQGPYYTHIEVGIADSSNRWYPQTGGTITLLPHSQTHVIVPMSDVGRDVELSAVEWLGIAPETVTEEEDYRGRIRLWRLGRRTLYLDNIRLVRVTGADTSALSNRSFEADGRIPAPWKGKNLTLKDRRVCKTAHDGSCSFRMVGTRARKSLRQVVRISGSAGDTFTLSGWSKAKNPLPSGGPYCLVAKLFHIDGTKKGYRTCFAKRTHGWQYKKRTFTVAKPYKKIVVFLLYTRQRGKAWFDDVRLRRH